MTNKLLYVLGLLIFMISCSREEKNSSFVTIQLPEASHLSKASNTIYTSDYYDEDSTWSSVIPSGINSGAAPINCYGIMVSGPEALLSENTCGRKAPGSTSDDIAYVDGAEYNFKLGLWAAAVPSGGTLEIEVPAGNDRIFRLIGFHATNAAACTNLKGSDNQSGLSKPYVISKSAKMSLAPGATVTVPMLMTFNSNHWFEECQGPSFNDLSGDKVPIVATKLDLFKPKFDEQSLIYNQCEPLDIVSVDSLGRVGRFPSNWAAYVLEIHNMASNPSVAVTTFPTLADCNAPTNGTDTLTITNSPSSMVTRRWIRQLASINSAYSIQPKIISVSTTDSSSPVILASSTKNFTSRNALHGTFQLVGPKRGVLGGKYRYKIIPRRFLGDLFSSSSGNSATVSITASTPSGPLPILYNADCITPIVAPIVADTNNMTKFPEFCVEFRGDFGVEQNILLGSGSLFNIPTTTTTVVRAFSIKTVGGSSNYLHHLAASGPRQIARAPGCYGPFSLSLENEAGAEINHTGSVPLSLRVINSDSVDITYHFEPNCNDGAGTSPFNFSIANGFSRKNLYLKILNTLPVGHRTLFLEDVNSDLKTELRFSLD